MANSLQTWEAMLSYLKTQSTLVSALANGRGTEIREQQWQGTDFLYPCLRLTIDFYPTVLNCGPHNFDAFLDTYSEQKSSRESQQITAILESIFDRQPFTYNGIQFPMIWIKKVVRPTRDIYAWKSCVEIKGMVN